MQLLVISSKSAVPTSEQYENDIVAVLPDEHIFSERELEIFTIVKSVKQKDVDDAKPKITVSVPTISTTEVNAELSRLETIRKAGKTLPTAEQVKMDLELEGTKRFRETSGKALVELKDAEMPRYELRYENGVIIENYTRAYDKVKAKK
jgi:hypothetical protein